MEIEDNIDMIVDPCYATEIAPVHLVKRDRMHSEEEWIKLNAKLIEQIGAEEWLKRHIKRLKSNEPHLGYVEPITKA